MTRSQRSRLRLLLAAPPPAISLRPKRACVDPIAMHSDFSAAAAPRPGVHSRALMGAAVSDVTPA
eukprot:6434378-Pyramimonas_sp.AAC.1